jgi:hypothetical protein
VKNVKAGTMNRKKYGWLHGVALSLLAYSLACCALPVSPPSKDNAPGAVRSAKQPPARALIFFQHPVLDSSELSGVIAEACRCQPVFFRQYRDNALIYIIALPQGQPFADFEKTLLQKAARFGIKSIEQDTIEHHY